MPLIGSYSVKDHKNDQHNYLYIYKYYKYNVYVFVINLFVICWNNRIKNHNRRQWHKLLLLLTASTNQGLLLARHYSKHLMCNLLSPHNPKIGRYYYLRFTTKKKTETHITDPKRKVTLHLQREVISLYYLSQRKKRFLLAQ